MSFTQARRRLGLQGPAKLDEETAKRQAREKLESFDFDFHESMQYVDYVTSLRGMKGMMGKIRGAFRWLYLVLVGFGAGLVAVAIQYVLSVVNRAKIDLQQEMSHAGYNLGVRFIVWLFICLALVSVAGVLVCYVEPSAAGSGISEIKCLLNGIHLPNVLLWRTLVSKAVGIVGSVAAGLPCGKEGPMIHSGAIVGAAASNCNAGPLVGPYRLCVEARDFTAAGAAAGVAAAFGAPIGGVLFAVEEGASHMNPIILVRVFVCAAVGSLTVRFFAGHFGESEEGGDGPLHWGSLGTRVPVEFGRFPLRTYWLWELAIFAPMGVVGGLFGALFNWLNTRLTIWRMRHIGPKGHLRFLEVLFVTTAIVSMNFFASLVGSDTIEMNDFGLSQKLFVQTGGGGIFDLFHKDGRFHIGSLFLFSFMHYFQTVWTYGLGVPSGLFVPGLLAGACFGRLLGEAMRPAGVEPGVYALIGATAMLSGIARITISLAVILMETTGEAEWGIPIFLTVMFAKWTGDLFNKGIYDIHIELKHVPLLEQRPEKHMIGFQANDIMAFPTVNVTPVARVGELVSILARCSHHGFPAVDPDSKRFVGLLERSTLSHLLVLGKEHGILVDAAPDQEGADLVAVVPYQEMVRRLHPQFPALGEVKAALAPEDYDRFIDLRPYINMGCYTIHEHAAAIRCYRLFRWMGLRHLPVLGDNHDVRGIITRKDLAEASEHEEEAEHRHAVKKTEEAPSTAEGEEEDRGSSDAGTSSSEAAAAPDLAPSRGGFDSVPL